MILHIGLDDTDSKKGMCTTYVGAVIVHRLVGLGVRIIGFPRLIRLNPNWKLKTRGNCCIGIRVETSPDTVSACKQVVLGTVEELAELHVETTNPGVVFLHGDIVPPELLEFSRLAIRDTVTIEDAERLAHHVGAEISKFKLGRGIIGGLAAIGAYLEKEMTYELIAYRVPEYRGKKRLVDPLSVVEMNELTYPETFDNIDLSTGEIRITPHTPCPVLYGIRGETPDAVRKADQLVRVEEPVERWIVYETNQATDAHLVPSRITSVKPDHSATLEGRVEATPRILRGGHVVFSLNDGTGVIDCAAYEPTRSFRWIAAKLLPGDLVRVSGGVKKKTGLPLTLNLEKLEIVELAPVKRNPRCDRCGRTCKSEGRAKGFQCPGCGKRFPVSAVELTTHSRGVKPGLYEVPPRARRHLAMPIVRARLY